VLLVSDTLSGRGLLLAVGTSVCSALGIVMLKRGLEGGVVHIVPLAAGILIYGLGIVLGMLLVGRYALSVAYPIVVGLSLVFLAAASALALGETLSPLKLAGTALIVLGVVLLTRPAASSVSRP
jgi:multidrug transporter EmrE-like cation transporter